MNKVTKNTFLFSTIAAISIATFAITQIVKVKGPGTNKDDIPNENQTISLQDAIKNNVKMKKVGDTCSIKATVLPENASDKRLSWELSTGYEDKLSYTISDDTGTITLKKLANYSSYYTLTVKSLDNPLASASCKVYSFNDIESISFTKFTYEGEDIDNTRLESNKSYQVYLKVNATSDNTRTLDYKYNEYTYKLSDNLKNILTIGNAGPDLGGTPIYSIKSTNGYIEFVLASITFNKEAFDALDVKTLSGSIYINDIECKLTIGAYVKVSSIVLDNSKVNI